MKEIDVQKYMRFMLRGYYLMAVQANFKKTQGKVKFIDFDVWLKKQDLLDGK